MKRRIGVAASFMVALLLFGGGVALGTSQGGGGFAANLSDAFRSAFGGSGSVTEISLGGTVRSSPELLVSDSPPLAVCEYDDDEGSAGPVMLSEIAWMGSVAGAKHEWVELANASGAPADISGWQVADRGKKTSVTLPPGTVIAPHGFLLLVREGAAVDAHGASAIPYRGSLNNANEEVALFDAGCGVADLVAANPSWPAGDNATKRTMERDLAE